MRILILIHNTIGRYDWGLQLFRNEIARQHDVIFYGTGHPEYDKQINGVHVPELLKIYAPIDMIIIDSFKYCSHYTGLELIQNVLKVCTVMDYYGVNCNAYNNFINTRKIDAITIPYPSLLQVFKEYKSKGTISKSILEFLMPFSVNINIYKPLNLPIENDVIAISSMSSAIYPNRLIVYNTLNSMKNIKTLTARSASEGIIHNKYIEVINKSKIFANAVDTNKLVTMKFTEVMACGTLFLTDYAYGLDQLRFIDKKHLVLYNGIDDMKNKIIYYLEYEDARNKIAKAGMEFVRKYHSNEIRVRQLIKELKEHI